MRRVPALLLLFFSSYPAALRAQSMNGSIAGRVTDPTKAFIVDAKVALLARSNDALKELAQKLPGSLPFTVDMTQFNRVREPVGAPTRRFSS